MRIAFLGPEGTHTGEAARGLDLARAKGAVLLPEPTIRAAFARFAAGSADAVVLPIENSLEGSVGPTLDLLAGKDGDGARIRRETVRAIAHALLAPRGEARDSAVVKRVLSHPQALAQCAENIARRFPRATVEPAASTAEAAQRIAESGAGSGMVALAPRECAARFGLEIREDDLSDDPGNRTRFVLVAREDELAISGSDRTSIVFGLDRDRPGGLHEALGAFATRGINLSRIESRPTRRALGEYWFFVDLEGHRFEEKAAEAIAALEKKTAFFRMLGSYPRA